MGRADVGNAEMARLARKPGLNHGDIGTVNLGEGQRMTVDRARPDGALVVDLNRAVSQR